MVPPSWDFATEAARARRESGPGWSLWTPIPPCFPQKRLQVAENKRGECKKERQERTRGGKLMKIKGKWRVASGDMEPAEIPAPPGNADGYQNKGVAGIAIRKSMKTKGEEKWLVGSEWWVTGEDNVTLSDTHRIAGKGRDETGTRSAEPWLGDYRIRYCLSRYKLKTVD
jgi:hypothetical protein